MVPWACFGAGMCVIYRTRKSIPLMLSDGALDLQSVHAPHRVVLGRNLQCIVSVCTLSSVMHPEDGVDKPNNGRPLLLGVQNEARYSHAWM